MSKYIDAELLRKEIEFSKSVYSHPNRVIHGVADGFRQDGRAAMCDDILKKIDSLQQEQQGVDLEKEIELAMPQPYSFLEVGVFNAESVYSKEQMVATARHFYELGQKDAANKYDEIEYNRQRAEEAGQGVTFKVTDDTTWGEVNDFIHRNCDGVNEIQIRKKEESK